MEELIKGLREKNNFSIQYIKELVAKEEQKIKDEHTLAALDDIRYALARLGYDVNDLNRSLDLIRNPTDLAVERLTTKHLKE